MDLLSTQPYFGPAALQLGVPATYLLAALACAVRRTSPSAAWRWASVGASVALAAAALALLWTVSEGAEHDASWNDVAQDRIGAIVLLLVGFVGWVIVRYSRTYLAGEPGQTRYTGWLMATLAAVGTVIVTNNLAVLAVAWTATSLALHELLTFYRQRPAALIAAHKKFLASRVADAFLLAAVLLIGHSLGTLDIDEIARRAQLLATLPTNLQIGVVLIVVAALLRSAQLPFHGWLIQVMEAPTPVSALLHAGIVNLGGFVLIRLSTLVAATPTAYSLLIVVGTATAVLAALVMTTRISIKVALAWSTCAQMGFMLLQIGLGAYELALLHLIAHSLYKAHAFLSAGGAVAQTRVRQLTAPAPAPAFATAAVGLIAGSAVVGIAAALWRIPLLQTPSLWLPFVVVCLALAPSLAPAGHSAAPREWLLGFAAAFAVALLYFGLHDVTAAWLGIAQQHNSVAPALIGGAALAFLLLFALQTAIAARPHSRFLAALYPWFYNGLYLDELFTRATFRVWPLRSARPPTLVAPLPTAGAS